MGRWCSWQVTWLRGVTIALIAVCFTVPSAFDPPAVKAASPVADDLQDDLQMEETLTNYLSGLDAEYGVAVINMEDGRSAFVNADEEFPAASMYKLLVMYRVYAAIENGYLALDNPVTILRGDTIADEPGGWYLPGETTTVEQALGAMITESSNAAAFALTRMVGGWGAVESAAAELGMYDTYNDGDEFWTTPGDMARFFRLLADWDLLSHYSSQEMIALLLGQTKRNRLPALLPDEVSLAHKTGELPEVRNDGGIAFAPGGWYVIVTMSKNGDPDEQIPALARLSYLVYQEYGE